MLLRLEHKLCAEVGLVRGWRCQLVQLVLHPHEPPIDEDPSLPLHASKHQNLHGLSMQSLVPAASTSRHKTAAGSFSRHTPAGHNSSRHGRFHAGAVAAMTAYLLQGPTVPAAIFDFSGAPILSRDMLWTSFSVHLSRALLWPMPCS